MQSANGTLTNRHTIAKIIQFCQTKILSRAEYCEESDLVITPEPAHECFCTEPSRKPASKSFSQEVSQTVSYLIFYSFVIAESRCRRSISLIKAFTAVQINSFGVIAERHYWRSISKNDFFMSSISKALILFWLWIANSYPFQDWR